MRSYMLGLSLMTLLSYGCFAQENMYIDEVVDDVSVLKKSERLSRINNALSIIAKEPKSQFAKKTVGLLLKFRIDFKGDLANQVAQALTKVTNQKFGTDFEAWWNWYQTVKDQTEWKAIDIYRVVPNPKYKKHYVTIYSPNIKELKDGWKEVSPYCIIVCPDRGLYIKSENSVKIKHNKEKWRLELKGKQIAIQSGTGKRAPATILNKAEIVLFDLDVIWLNRNKLNNIQQHCDQKIINDTDPQKVYLYVMDEARKGNFRPLFELVNFTGSDVLEDLNSHEFKVEFAEKNNIPLSTIKTWSTEQFFLESVRSEEFPDFLLITEIEIEQISETTVEFTNHRFFGMGSGRLVLKNDRWVIP